MLNQIMQQPKDIVRSLVKKRMSQIQDFNNLPPGEKGMSMAMNFGPMGLTTGIKKVAPQLAEQIGSRIMKEPKLVVRGKLMDLFGRLSAKKPVSTDITKAENYLKGKKVDLDPMFKVEQLPPDLPK